MSFLHKKSLHICLVSILFTTVTLLTSCSAPKKVRYFQNIPDSLQTPAIIPVTAYNEPTIEANDILNISVQTADQKEVAKSAASTQVVDEMTGYKVDKNGEVDVPLVGSVKVSGLTTTEAKEQIKEKAKKFYVDPIVNLKFGNHYIDVIGEVSRPGRISLPGEKITLIDAISLAGDLTIQGKRENILLMREENGKKVCVRLNINGTDFFQSPYYYVKSGDYIYVEPNKAKTRGATNDPTKDRYISYVSTFVSLAAIIFTIIINVNNLTKK